jgi:hypothetical protein
MLAKNVTFKDYTLSPLSFEKISALSTLKMARASSSETSLKITCQNIFFLKTLLLHRQGCANSNHAIFCYNDAEHSAKYCSLKVPSDKGIIISALR